MSSGAQYVVAAHAVVLVALVVYALVAGLRAARLAREAELLARLTAREERPAAADRSAAEPAAAASETGGAP